MNHLYLIRHGENIANLTLEFSHRKVDYSLTPKGVLQARQTAAFFAGKKIHAIYTSPLKRALETAEIIAAPLGLPVIPLENFREVNVGDLEGQKPTAALWALHNSVLSAWRDGRAEARFPGGENYPELLNRIQSGFAEVLAGGDDREVIIVGHGGLFSSAIRDLCSGFDPVVYSGGIPNCSVTELEGVLVGTNMKLHLLSYATISHLSGEAADLAPGYPVNDGLLEGE